MWESIFRSREWGRYPAEDLIRFACRETKGKGSVKALEIGCGPGANVCFMAARGIDCDAVDGSPTAVAKAQRRLAEMGLAARVKEADFRALPREFTGYDIAIDSEALCCVDQADCKAVIREIHRRLKPSGAFWSRTFAQGTWRGVFDGMEPIRTMARDEIEAVYGDWASINIGEITRHEGNPQEMVREWIITARK